MADGVLMTLGNIRFSLSEGAYDNFRRSSAYTWSATKRIGRHDALQFGGMGEDSISLEGVIYPHFRGSMKQIDLFRSEAAKGEAMILTDGRGNVYGQWVITNVEEGQSVLFSDGAPRKIEFSLSLKFYGEDL